MSKSQFRATDFIQLISCAVIFYHCRWSLVLIAFLTAIASAEAAPIALPFTGRRASLGLDGQHVALRIDTGSARYFAINGPEYEKQNGEGSCKSSGACYFCPPNNPCDDILHRQRWHVRFRNGVSYAYVEHTVTLSIGGMTIPNFKFGLAIEFNDESGERAPFSTGGQLGLSYGREGIPETFLEQLQARRVIAHLTYWVRTDEGASSFSGKLTLDESPKTDAYAIRLRSDSRQLKVSVWSLHFLSPQGRFMPRRLLQPAKIATQRPTLISVDTGAASIHAELEDFNRFTEVAQRYLRRDSESGLYVVNKTDITNLPALFYGIGDLHNRAGIRIQPKHYVKCENDGNGACFVYFRYWSENACVLGRPFFHAYDVGFDLESDPPSIYLKSDDVYDEVETMV